MVDLVEGEAEAADIEAVEGEADAHEAEAVDVRALASEMGWSPREKWTGDPALWRDEGAFLKSTVGINRRLQQDLKEMRRTSEKMERVAAGIAQRQIADAVAEVEARHADAVDKGDLAAANKAAKDMARLERETAAAESSNDDDDDPDVADFMERNAAWYNRDEEATAFAVSLSQRLAAKKVPVPDQLRQVEVAVRKRFPEHYPPARKPAIAVNGAGSRQAEARLGDAVARLPASARRVGEDFVRKGLVKNIGDYAAAWHEENGQ